MSRSQVSVPRTAIVPAAGLGTRFLPATKTVPKELLPVVDTPGIELVAAEAAEAGADRLVIVTSEGKDGVVAHFVEDLVLEGTLEARGKKAMLAKVRRAPGLIKVESVVQAEPLGLGHAISCRPTRMLSRSFFPTTWWCRPACWRRCRRCAPNTAARCCARSRFHPRR
jgi:UTP--glucose-1-phosphate uridylyltransferase